MEKREVTNDPSSNYDSLANRIPEKHQIVQHDVNDAILELQGTRHISHSQAPAEPASPWGYWSEKRDEAHRTLMRARAGRQPGEAGSSTFCARSNRPGSIVRE